MWYLLLIPWMAVLNRWRGSDWPKPWCAFIAKILAGFTIGYLAYPEYWYFSIFIAFGLYWIGEIGGWGKWIGTLIDGKPRPTEKEIELIDNIAKKLTGNYIKQAKIALAIRGFVWWFPAFLIFAYQSPTRFVISVILCSITFPLSIIYTRKFFLEGYAKDSKDAKWVWSCSEVAYGLFHGISLIILVGV